MGSFRVHCDEQTAGLIAAQAAQRLRESNRLLSIAERLAHLGRWRLDPREGEIERSQQASAILGIGASASLTPKAALARIDERDRFSLLRCLVRAYRRDSDTSCRTRIKLGGDKYRTVLVHAQNDRRAGGSQMAIFGVIRDISAEVAAEAKLIAARDEARAATQAKSEFLATMSHEIRTPMTGVMGMIDLIAAATDEAERAQFLAALRHSAHMLMSVLDSILDFSKVEAGRIDIVAKSLDLVELARQTVLLFANAGSAKGIALEFDADPGVSPIVCGDALRLQQVMSNFISNAVKFTSHGRVLLSLRARPGRAGHQRWAIEVSDTGAGIKRPELKRLFEPFIQVGDRSAGGTGLGLAISRRLAEAMGGNVKARSKPGQGSIFSLELELPVEFVAPAVASHDGAALNAQPTPSLNILVAEDNPINQMLIVAMLRRLGHRATTADNGRRAVECALAVPFDCILMDMQMPDMDGVQATRAIRSSSNPNKQVPIIALTADAASERRRFYDNIGLSGFMTKPIDVQELRQMLVAIAAGPNASRPVREPATAIDQRQLDAIRSSLGEDKLRDLLELAHIELAERPAGMRKFAASEDYALVRSEAHGFKGAVSSLGLIAAARAAKAVELAAPGAELELALSRLEREALRARTSIAPMLCGLPTISAVNG